MSGALSESRMEQATLHSTLFQLDTFRGQFQVAAFLDRLSDLVLDQADLRKRVGGKSPGVPRPQTVVQESLGVVHQLLQQFERADKELVTLQRQVEEELRAASRELEGEEENFQMTVDMLESSLADVNASFETLDEQMSHLSQTAANVGNRLQSAEAFRQRALGAVESINYLQEFANITDFDQLSELFQDDDRLAEAAAVTRSVHSWGTGLITAKERAGQASESEPQGRPLQHVQKGTIEHAVLQVEAYRNVLENRVVSHFDSAAAQGDLGGMAECARIMSEFPRGAVSLMQRYISTRPMFMDVKQLGGGKPSLGEPPSSAISALQALAVLYKSILAAFKEESLVLQHVFPTPEPALAMFVQRVFEQRVQAALDGMLQPGPPANASAEALQQHLKLLHETYKRTLSLADSLQELVGNATQVSMYVDVVFSEALHDYPGMELTWLQRLYMQRSIQGQSPEALAPLFAWNTEAVERCIMLSPESARAENVRQLFHASTVDHANLGCLLEQVASQVIAGLAKVGTAGGAPAVPYSTASVGTMSRSAITKAAAMVAREGVGHALEVVAQATAAIQGLQGQYARVIQEHVTPAPAEAAACSAGLAALVRAIEDRVLAVIRDSLVAFFAQVDQTLAAEQKRMDFRPLEDGAAASLPALDRPTDTCRLVTALFKEVLRVASDFLQGSNLASFNAEVGRRAHAQLLAHMQRFTYSATGALRWKRDLQEYAEALHAAASPTVDAQMEELSSLANMLVVAPDSLVGLVEGSLRISHRQALLFIRLRDDFRTAKVDGISLPALFAQD